VWVFAAELKCVNVLIPVFSAPGRAIENPKTAVFWVVAPCSLVEVTDLSEALASSIMRDALMMEAARTSETLVNFYQTTSRYNPEDSHLRTHRRENLKS
jgi:hypothetical protein